MRASFILLIAVCLSACGLPQPERDLDYADMFVHDHLVEWKISIENDDWHELLLHPSVYKPADVEVDGVLYKNVGLRLSRNQGRSKIGMRIRFNQFNPSLRFHGAKRVNLRNNAGDPTLVREALALHLMRKAGVPAPRASFVWVDWGLGGGIFTLVEQVDRRFLKDRFDDNDGNLYRVETGGNLVYQDDDQESYDWLYTYSPRTNEERANYADLIGLMKLLANSSRTDLERDLPRLLDLDEFLRALAVNSWLANMDSYAATGRNFYLYHDLSTRRFRFIPWDLNRSFGNYHGSHCRDLEGERACVDFGARVCEERAPQDWGWCAESIADLCAGHVDEVCAPEYWEIFPTACQNPPPACGTVHYTTDEMLALDPEAPGGSMDRPLIERVLGVGSFRLLYRRHLRELIEGVLSPEEVEADMRFMRDLVAERAKDDVWREHAYALEDGRHVDFKESFDTDTLLDQHDRSEDYVPGLMPFVLARDELITESLGGP